uniref:Alternative protein SV2A n=1 Tax=Homo sapiens TaxID=9606 RepID=L8E840_HUMAN|nr:alternative protein SV2A [Homo sapiens]
MMMMTSLLPVMVITEEKGPRMRRKVVHPVMLLRAMTRMMRSMKGNIRAFPGQSLGAKASGWQMGRPWLE